MEPTVPGLIDGPRVRRLPVSAQAQLGHVLELFRSSFGSALRDVILHGSAATSGFAPGRSDLDLLALVDTAALAMVPRRDDLRAIASDLAWAERAGLAAYAHANACRTLAYLRSGEILSRHEGLAWCTNQGVDSAHALVAALLELQRALDEDAP